MLFESRHVGAGIAKHEWSHVQFRSVAAGHLIADCDRGVPIFFGSSYVSIGKPVDMGSVYVGPTGRKSIYLFTSEHASKASPFPPLSLSNSSS
jgi:hypothetical protein